MALIYCPPVLNSPFVPYNSLRDYRLFQFQCSNHQRFIFIRTNAQLLNRRKDSPCSFPGILIIIKSTGFPFLCLTSWHLMSVGWVTIRSSRAHKMYPLFPYENLDWKPSGRVKEKYGKHVFHSCCSLPKNEETLQFRIRQNVMAEEEQRMKAYSQHLSAYRLQRVII